MSMRGRKATVLLVVASVVFSVLVVDLGLLLVLGPVRVVEDFYESEPRFGYRMRPHQQFVFASPYHGYHATVRTNAHGLRDDEIVLPKPPGTFRILLLGDSMTAGLEVDKQRTFEALLEQQLATSGAVEVINAGVRGYNLDNIVAFLEAEGLSYEPDLVVYLFVDNDLTDEATAQPRLTDASRGFRWQGWWGRFASYSHITHRVSLVTQMLALRRQRDRSPEAASKVTVSNGLYVLFNTTSYEASAFHRTGERIAKLAALARSSGSDFLLVGAPHREEIDPESQAWWQRHLGAASGRLDFDGVRHYLNWVAEGYGAAYLDPVPLFRNEIRNDGNYWFHKDLHLNAAGHSLLSGALAEYIVQNDAFETWQVLQTKQVTP
jgi:lysophospholipase L1-like esterase